MDGLDVGGQLEARSKADPRSSVLFVFDARTSEKEIAVNPKIRQQT